MLQVTVSVTRPPTAAPNNTLKRVEIGATRNASVEIAGQTLAADGAALPLVPGSQSTTFVVRRQTPGQAVTVPLTVTDDCGAWKTFVGGGLAAF